MMRSKIALGILLAGIIALGYGGMCGGGNDSSSGSSDNNNQTPNPAPQVTSISPTSGYNDLYTSFSITGTNFQSGATVQIGSTTLTATAVTNFTTITCTLYNALTAGAYDVKVTNSDNQYDTLTNAFTSSNPPSEWTKETLGAWGVISPLSSTCTILMDDNNTYRMYFGAPGGIYTSTSTDGLTWNAAVSTGITTSGAGGPGVIKLTSGTYLMIYGVQLPGPTESLYRATSADGITFTTSPASPVLTADTGENNFVSVPDLTYITGTNRLRMYFVASTSASWTHTAYSDDNGATWPREGKISVTGGAIGGQLNDPDIIQLVDGRYWLLFTTPPAGQSIGNLRMRSAISTDGRNFTLESGSRVTPSGSVTVIMDPDTILLKGTTDKYRTYHGGVIGLSTPDVLRAIASP